MDYTDSEDEPMNPPAIVTHTSEADDGTIKRALRRILKCEFSLRRRKDAVYFHTHTRDDYDTLIKFLQFHEHGYYTYRPPWDDTQLIVLKNYLGYDASKIITDLDKKGIKCLGVHLMSRKPANQVIEPPAILLTLAGHTNLDWVRRMRSLGNIAGLSWLDYTASKYVPIQCHRCQRFHHDSRFCFMTPNCYRCGEEHLSEDCQNKTSSLKCFNCKAEHYAYYADCPEWILYKDGLMRAREKAARMPAKKETRPVAKKFSPRRILSTDELAKHVDSFWNLAQDLGIQTMCFDYNAMSISFDYGPIPTNGAPSPPSSPLAGERPYKIGLRRSALNKYIF